MTHVEETKLTDGSMRLLLDIEPHLFVTIGFILESMEGFCIYTTVRRDGKQFLQIDIPPDYISTMKRLLKDIGVYLRFSKASARPVA